MSATAANRLSLAMTCFLKAFVVLFGFNFFPSTSNQKSNSHLLRFIPRVILLICLVLNGYVNYDCYAVPNSTTPMLCQGVQWRLGLIDVALCAFLWVIFTLFETSLKNLFDVATRDNDPVAPPSKSMRLFETVVILLMSIGAIAVSVAFTGHIVFLNMFDILKEPNPVLHALKCLLTLPTHLFASLSVVLFTVICCIIVATVADRRNDAVLPTEDGFISDRRRCAASRSTLATVLAFEMTLSNVLPFLFVLRIGCIIFIVKLFIDIPAYYVWVICGSHIALYTFHMIGITVPFMITNGYLLKSVANQSANVDSGQLMGEGRLFKSPKGVYTQHIHSTCSTYREADLYQQWLTLRLSTSPLRLTAAGIPINTSALAAVLAVILYLFIWNAK